MDLYKLWSLLVTSLLITGAVSGIGLAQDFDSDPLPKSTNFSGDEQDRVKQDQLNTYEPGTYLVYSDQIGPSMQVQSHLMTIPYSIVQIDRTIQSPNKLYPNREIRMDLSSPSLDQSLETDDIASTIDINPVWDKGYSGENTVVAIVDTGINFSHPSLQGKRVEEKSFHKKQYGFGEDLGPMDQDGHGTLVASVAAGNDPGYLKAPAFDAKLVNVRVGLENPGQSSKYSTTLSVVAALDWAFSLNYVDVVSMSLSELEEGFSFDPLEEIVNQGVTNGKIFVSSVGNKYHNPYMIGSPSSSPETISVGATSSSNNIAYYSAMGPSYSDEAKPDLVAPGSVEGANFRGGYYTKSGTSFSTPTVTGSIATLIQYLKENNISISPGQMKAVLGHAATDLGVTHYLQGFGQINVSKSLHILETNGKRPLIGPREGTIPSVELPVNTQVTLPLTIAGGQVDDIVIKSNVSSLTTEYKWRYQGETSILHLKLDLNSFVNVSAVTFQLEYTINNSAISTLYTISVEVLPEPKFQVLLDLKHTMFDTILESGTRVERKLGGIDISPLHAIILQQGGWLTELIDPTFDISILQNYDILWMPSAFGIVSPVPYDHEYQNTHLTKQEMFDLYSYLMEGGSLILDFGGTFVSSKDYTTDQPSLLKLQYLLGNKMVQTGEGYFSSTTITSIVQPTSLYLPVGEIEFKHGIPFVGGTYGYSSVAQEIGDGNIYIHNNRNWRTKSVLHQENITNYFENVLSFLNDQSVVQNTSINSSHIILEVNKNFTTFDNLDFQVVQGDNTVGIDVSKNHNNVIIEGNYQENETISLKIMQGDILYFEFQDIIPVDQAKLRNLELKKFNNRVELTAELSAIDFIEDTAALYYNDQEISSPIQIQANNVTYTYYTENPDQFGLYQFKLQMIDQYGRLLQFTAQDIQTVETDQKWWPFFLFGTTLILITYVLHRLVQIKSNGDEELSKKG